MGTSTNTALYGLGQSNFDTFDISVVNNGTSFIAGAPIGGVMPYAASYSQHSATPPYPPPNDTPSRMAMPIYASQSISNTQIRLTGNGAVSNPTVEVDYFFMYGASLGSLAQGQTIVRMPYGASFPSQPLGLIYYQDVQNVELIPAGDVACYCVGFTGSGATGGICAPTANWQTDFTNGISVPLSSSPNKNSLPYVPLNIHLNGQEWLGAIGDFYNETNHPGQVQQLMPCSGTWSNLTMQLDGSSYTADSYLRTFTSFHGPNYFLTTPGSMPYGSQVVSINGLPANQASKAFTVSNPQNVDIIPKNDFIGVEYSCATNTQAVYYMGMTSLFTSSDPNTTPFVTGGEPSNTNNNAALSYQQIAPGGGQARPAPNSTSEALALAVISGTFSNLTVACDTVGTGGTGAFYINNTTNNMPTPPTIHQVLSFSGTGKTQTDPQNVDLITAGEAYCNTFTGFLNTYTITSQSVAFQSVGPASSGHHMTLMGIG